MTKFGNGLMDSVDELETAKSMWAVDGGKSAKSGSGEQGAMTDREALDILMGVVLNTIWNLLAHAYTSPHLPAEMKPERKAMEGAAIFLKRVLILSNNYAYICPACGALNNLPPYTMPADISIVLLEKIGSLHGRTLEAAAMLLSSVLQHKAECDTFKQAGGADIILIRLAALVEEARRADNGGGDAVLVELKGSSLRAHTALASALMTAVCSAARLLVHKSESELTVSYEDEEAVDGGAAAAPASGGYAGKTRRRQSIAVAAKAGTSNVTQVGGGSSNVHVREDHDRIALWMEKLDENHDGNVTYEELLAVVLDHGGTADQVRPERVHSSALPSMPAAAAPRCRPSLPPTPAANACRPPPVAAVDRQPRSIPSSTSITTALSPSSRCATPTT